MKLTVLVPLPLLLPPLAIASLAKPASWELELPPVPVVRSAAGARTPPVDEPATVGPAVVLPVSGPVVVPPVEPGVCGAAAVCGAEVELSLFAVDDVLTEVAGAVVGVPAVTGAEVLFASVVTVA